MITMGSRLKILRNKNNITIGKLAKFLGISIQAYVDYEKDRTCPQVEKLVKISKFFNVTTDYLIFGDDSPCLPPMVKDTYYYPFECLLYLLKRNFLQIEKLEHPCKPINFICKDENLKSLAVNFKIFKEKNKHICTLEEINKMSDILINKYLNDEIFKN